MFKLCPVQSAGAILWSSRGACEVAPDVHPRPMRGRPSQKDGKDDAFQHHIRRFGDQVALDAAHIAARNSLEALVEAHFSNQVLLGDGVLRAAPFLQQLARIIHRLARIAPSYVRKCADDRHCSLPSYRYL